MRANRPTVNKY